MFELEGVSFGYGPGKEVLREVTLSFDDGLFVLLTGPSGSGKSTLLRLLCGLQSPTRGTVRYCGKPLPLPDMPAFRRQVLYLQQTPVMLDLSIRENLLLGFRYRSASGCPLPGDDALRGLMEEFGLADLSLEENARDLSVGQKQRLAFIRALLLRPRVLLLDEPTASLDPVSRRVVEEKAERLNLEEGIGVFMVSHDGFRPERVRARILEVSGGKARWAE